MSTYLDGRSWEVSPRYVGRGNNPTGAVVKVPVRVKPDRFGVHTMRVEVQARNDLIESFLPQEGQVDPFREQLVYDPDSLEITYGENSWGTIVADFKGIIQTRANEYTKRKAGFAERSVTLYNTTGGTLVVTYKGPRTIYTYSSTGDPGSPQFAGQLEPGGSDFEVISIRSADTAVLLGNVNLATLEAAGFLWSIVVRTTTFDREEDGAGIWRCTEVNEGLILSDIGAE